MRHFRRSLKAISPVLAVLMMIAVAIAGSLITYAWVTGYIGFTTEKSGKAIMIQSIANTNGGADLSIYVQNVGEGTVELDPDSCLYLNGELTPCSVDPADGLVGEGDTATLLVTGGGAGPGEKIVAKVTTLLGTFTEKSTYPTLGGGGGGTPTPPPTVTRVQHNEGTIDLDGTSPQVSFGSAPAEGNLLVVIAGHRTGNPSINDEPTITQAGWTRHEVVYYYTGTGDRRIVAIWSKIAGSSEGTAVTIDWDAETTGQGFAILQEFTGATTYTFEDAGGNTGTGSGVTTLNVPSTALPAPTNENILAIAGMVWRDDGDAITGVSYSNLGNPGIEVTAYSGLKGGSAFDYTTGSATVLQTTVTWTNSRMASGLLALFSCD